MEPVVAVVAAVVIIAIIAVIVKKIRKQMRLKKTGGKKDKDCVKAITVTKKGKR